MLRTIILCVVFFGSWGLETFLVISAVQFASAGMSQQAGGCALGALGGAIACAFTTWFVWENSGPG